MNIITLDQVNSQEVQDKKRIKLLGPLLDKIIGPLKGFVNIIFCDDAFIKMLNKQHRKKNKTTDVLSFTYFQGHKTALSHLLGEVVVNIDQTKRQAKKEEWPFSMELYKLCIHGLLHLRGYDHEKDKDYRVMKLLEGKIMKSFLESD